VECAQVPPAPGLAGRWRMDSRLHLRDALSRPLQILLDAGQIARGLLSGDLGGLGLPGWLSSILGPIVASVVDRYVPDWAQDLFTALGDVHDVLDDMRVRSDLTLTELCPEVYRTREQWTRLEFQFRGMLISRPPEEIPQIGTVEPVEYPSRVLCGELYLDAHRIHNVVGGLLRWVVDTVVEIVTCAAGGPCYHSPEEALDRLIDCEGLAREVDDLVQNVLPFAPSVYAALDGACVELRGAVTERIEMALDQAATMLGLLGLKGQGHVAGSGGIDQGSWAGSLLGGQFAGEWTATR
jgi:hypothetical protein